MSQQKIFVLINFVSKRKKETDAIRAMLSTPYFVKSDNRPKQLFELIVDKNITNKEVWFSQLFPHLKEYDDQRIRNTVSDLVRLLEQHLVIRRISKAEECRLLSHFYEEIQKEPFAKQKINQGIKTLEKEVKNTDPLEHYRLYEFNKMLYSKMDNYGKANENTLLFNINKHLSLAIDSSTIKIKLEQLFRHLVYGESTSDQFKTTPYASFLKFYTLLDHFLLSQDKDISDFQTIVEEFKSISAQQNDEDKIFLLLSLLNLCSYLSNAGGNEAYLKEQLNLYKYGLVSTILIQKLPLNPDIFINICMAACVNNDLRFAKKVLQEYQLCLDETKKDFIVRYCEAFILFFQKDYTKSNLILLSTHFEDPKLKMKANGLSLQCQLEFLNTTASQIDTLRAKHRSFINELNRLPNYASDKKIAYRNMADALLVIAENTHLERTMINKEQLKKIRSRLLDNEERFVDKKWLIGKVNELLK